MGEISDEQLWSWVDRDAAELAEHLARHPEDAARVAELRAAIDGVASAAAPELLPERIGDYEVVRRLGEGGMGIVYEALQASPRRPVALKVIRGGSGADEQRVRLFHREAEALARLNHPGIATIFEAGTTPQGEHFFAMELVAGTPLHRWVRERRPKRRVLLELFRSICEAVHYAHTQGVVHRDLKPSNVIVDEQGRPKVLDFGLARVAGGAGALATRATLGGALLGTLQYMSPEQAGGTSGAVDAASDVYSLGVVLFELLTGALPHELDELPLLDAARAIRELPPRLPSSLDRSLRGDLETIVSKALEKRPRDRYLSAAELAADVERFLEGLPINARRPSPGKRALRFVLRHKLGTVAALLAIALLVVAFGPQRGGGIDLEREYPGRGFAELSPFEDLRWRAWKPEVRVGGRWYELLAIEGANTGLVLEYCKQTEPGAWLKRFSEDLVDVLDGLGIDAGRAVDLELRDLETDRRLLLYDVPMTGENRRELRDARHKSAWDDLEWKGGNPHVLVDGTWSELLAIDGRPLVELRGLARRMLGIASPRAFLSEQVDLLTLATGDTPGPTVRLDLRDADGTERSVDAPLTARSYGLSRPLSGAPFSRTPFEAVRWPRPDRPLVLVQGRWYAPIALDGRAFADVLSVARDAYPDEHEQRVSEDLELVLEYMGVRMGDTADLLLTDAETHEPVELLDVPVTTEKRQRCRAYNRRRE